MAVQDSEDSKEQVDDVKVEADSGGDLLLDMVMAHDELSIDEDISAEDESSEAAVDELGGRVMGEEHGDEAEHDEAPDGTEQVRHPRREVILGLAGEQGEEDEYPGGDNGGVEDDGAVVERDDYGYGVGLEEGEAGQEDQIGGVGLALPVCETHEDHRTEELDYKVSYDVSLPEAFEKRMLGVYATYRNPDNSLVGLDPFLVTLAEEGDGADAGGNDDLEGEDGVDLAHELVADVDGRLCYRASELSGHAG